jgi:hypothetical protein
MSDQKPSNEGFGSSSTPIEDMLRDVRETQGSEGLRAYRAEV